MAMKSASATEARHARIRFNTVKGALYLRVKIDVVIMRAESEETPIRRKRSDRNSFFLSISAAVEDLAVF